MTIEQKARAYDEAIKKAKSKINHVLYEYDILDIFSELKESDDERVRKELIDIVKKSPITFAFEDKGKVLSWLEKQGEKESDPRYKYLKELLTADDIYQMAMNNAMVQEAKTKAIDALSKLEIGNLLEIEKQGEQKPADKVEQKFHKGDWVVSPNGVYWHIDAVWNGRYEVSSIDGIRTDWPFNTSLYHLWTIQDAKDGDVLVCEDFGYTSLMLFESFSNGRISLYCWHNSQTNNFHINTDVALRKDANIYPATKEQRDLLFQKMKEAGYEWDANKKELKKIEKQGEQKLVEFKPSFRVGDTIRPKDPVLGEPRIIERIYPTWGYDTNKGILDFEFEDNWELVEQKPAWSEEDEKTIKRIDSLLYAINENEFEDIHAWLKSLKNRVIPQPKPEWSEEDEYNIAFIVELLYGIEDTDKEYENKCRKMANWLKSLRPQKQWKPSEEQMEALLDEVNAWDENSANGQNLKSLYEQLKKLREE